MGEVRMFQRISMANLPEPIHDIEDQHLSENVFLFIAGHLECLVYREAHSISSKALVILLKLMIFICSSGFCGP